MDARLRVRIALHADGLARTFAGAGVGLRALAAHREAAHVADAAIALDALQTLQIHADLAAKIAFDDILAVLDRVHDLRQLRFGEVLRADAGVDLRLGEDVDRVLRADAVNVAQRN